MLYCPNEGDEHEERCEVGDQDEEDDAHLEDNTKCEFTGDEECPESEEEPVKTSPDPHEIAPVPVKFPEICYVAYMGYEVMGTKEDLLSGAHDNDIIRLLQTIVAVEGPITRDRCIARLLPHWQITRKTAPVKNKIESVLLSLPFHQETEGDLVFFWSDNQAFLEYVTFRSHPAGDPWQRKVDEISIHEYSNAIIHLMKQKGSLSIHVLNREIGSLFGIKRMSPALETRIRQGISLLMDRGELRKEGEELMYVPQD